MARYTNSQRTKIKMGKQATKRAKYKAQASTKTAVGVAREIGNAASNIAASYAAQRGVEHYTGMKSTTSSDYANALKAYQDIISGKGSDSSAGNSGNKSTTEVGGSGSALGG